MLIGDKGESGGRRWVWSRFAMGTFLDPSGQSLGGDFWAWTIFLQSQGQTLGCAFS